MSPTRPAPTLRVGARGRSLAIAIALVALALPGSASAADSVFWTNAGIDAISRANLDGSGGSDLATGLAIRSEPVGITLDTGSGRVYWANRKEGSISYVNLDGSGAGNLPIPVGAIEHPSGIALDPATGRIYWADTTLDAIAYTSLNGSGTGTLKTTGATVKQPEGVALDLAAGRIYWANREGNAISYASLGGNGGADLATGTASVSEPIGPAIDAAAGRIYWSNLGSNTISYASLNGGGGADLATGTATLKAPAGVAIDPDANRVYWANGEASAISYASLNGSGGSDLGTAGASFGRAALPALLESPRGTGIPEISGQHLIERPLFCSQGSWATDLLGAQLYRAPESFEYSWLRNGEPIDGATELNYRPTKPGAYDCRVTATNQAGSTTQTSADLTLARGLAFAEGVAPVHGRTALLRMRCVGDGRCRGMVKLIAHVGYSQVVHREGHREVIRHRALFPIGKARFSIFPGRAKVVRVRLKRKGKRLLNNRRRHQLGTRLLGRDVDHRRVLLKRAS